MKHSTAFVTVLSDCGRFKLWDIYDDCGKLRGKPILEFLTTEYKPEMGKLRPVSHKWPPSIFLKVHLSLIKISILQNFLLLSKKLGL